MYTKIVRKLAKIRVMAAGHCGADGPVHVGHCY